MPGWRMAALLSGPLTCPKKNTARSWVRTSARTRGASRQSSL